MQVRVGGAFRAHAVRAKGQDPFADGNAATGLACRLYRTDNGVEGAPSISSLVDVLRRHGRRSPLERSVGDDLAQQVRRVAFQRLRTGHAITPGDLAAQLGVSPRTLNAALAGLARAGLIDHDPTGAVAGAHGLTPTPTRHHLVLAGVALHTGCALDAVRQRCGRVMRRARRATSWPGCCATRGALWGDRPVVDPGPSWGPGQDRPTGTTVGAPGT